MELIDQHTKAIMEECKVRARDAGLSFDDESLEYIVTNRDLLELSPKVMIPTLYDYWLDDVEVLKNKGQYKLYPGNPYETVINSRPAISFYNDNNPDWLNIMIFYHVLAHIDFFQNNILFEKTWKDDFAGQALADKRLIENLRSEHGRWVDYVIEFSRGIDNLAGYYDALARPGFPDTYKPSDRVLFYFDVFLQEILKSQDHEIFKEIERYNQLVEQNPELGESLFFSEIRPHYPEFEVKFEKYRKQEEEGPLDLMGFIRDNSVVLQKEDNQWMKSVLSVVRNTALYLAPQIRTKILNEGWASYWHDELFRKDDRISGHEIAYARINAGVTALSRVGLNPYAIGLRLIQYIEELADKGKLDFNFQNIQDIQTRENFDKKVGTGREAIFKLRKYSADFPFINKYVDQDFIDKHDLFVAGKRPNMEKGTIEYFVKSRKGEDYKKMLIDSLYHPPSITVVPEKTNEKNIYLSHDFEGKQLIRPFVANTMIGIEYLWGGQVQLETTEIVMKKAPAPGEKPEFSYNRVLYTMKDKRLSRGKLE